MQTRNGNEPHAGGFTRGDGVWPGGLGCCRSGEPLVTEEIGLMRKRYTWLAGILATLAALLPAAAHAQIGSEGYSPPDPNLPLPLASTHMAMGGLYLQGS